MANVDELAQQTRISFGKAVDKISSWIDAFIGHIPNMAVAVLVFIVFFISAKYSKRWVERLFDRSSRNDVIKNLSSSIVYFTVIGLGVFIILEVLNLKTAVTSLLAGVGIVGIALGFAFQDIAANFLSGIILAYRKPFDISDIIQTGDFIGSVSQINIRDTVIKTFQGQEVVIPNRSVIQNPIINYTILGERRVDLPFRALFNEDISKIRLLVIQTLASIDQITRKEDIDLVFTGYDHSAINYEIRFWINYRREKDYIDTQSLVIMRIHKTFEENGISAPFTVRLNAADIKMENL